MVPSSQASQSANQIIINKSSQSIISISVDVVAPPHHYLFICLRNIATVTRNEWLPPRRAAFAIDQKWKASRRLLLATLKLIDAHTSISFSYYCMLFRRPQPWERPHSLPPVHCADALALAMDCGSRSDIIDVVATGGHHRGFK